MTTPWRGGPFGNEFAQLTEAVLAVAAADLQYEEALQTHGPLIARGVLKTRCVPARRAYRRALQAAVRARIHTNTTNTQKPHDELRSQPPA